MSRPIAVALIVLGVAIAVRATIERRRRWRDAAPFAGGERSTPEPAIVPNSVVYLVYLAWLLVGVGAVVLAVTWDS